MNSGRPCGGGAQLAPQVHARPSARGSAAPSSAGRRASGRRSAAGTPCRGSRAAASVGASFMARSSVRRLGPRLGWGTGASPGAQRAAGPIIRACLYTDAMARDYGEAGGARSSLGAGGGVSVPGEGGGSGPTGGDPGEGRGDSRREAQGRGATCRGGGRRNGAGAGLPGLNRRIRPIAGPAVGSPRGYRQVVRARQVTSGAGCPGRIRYFAGMRPIAIKHATAGCVSRHVEAKRHHCRDGYPIAVRR